MGVVKNGKDSVRLRSLSIESIPGLERYELTMLISLKVEELWFLVSLKGRGPPFHCWTLAKTCWSSHIYIEQNRRNLNNIIRAIIHHSAALYSIMLYTWKTLYSNLGSRLLTNGILQPFDLLAEFKISTTLWHHNYLKRTRSLWHAICTTRARSARDSRPVKALVWLWYFVAVSFIDPVLLQKETWTKLTLFILDSSVSSKLFFLEVQ